MNLFPHYETPNITEISNPLLSLKSGKSRSILWLFKMLRSTRTWFENIVGEKSIIFVSPSFRYTLVWHSQALIGHSYPLLWAVNYCSTISSFKHGPKGVPPKNSNGLKTLFLSPLLKKYINFSISFEKWFYFEDLQSKSPQNKHF